MTGAEFLRTFEEPPAQETTSWIDAVADVVGVIVVVAFLGWLAGGRR